MNQLNWMRQTTLKAALVAALGMSVLPWNAQAALEKEYNLTETDSQIIKFDKGLKRALIANPELASVKVLSNNELLLTGKGAGRTQLIVTYRDTPDIDHQVVLNVAPDQSRREEIETTLTKLLKDLNPQGTVAFELKNIWINSESAVRREVDEIGTQIDNDAALKTSKRQDKEVLQSEEVAGSNQAQPLAGNYMVLLSGEVSNKAQKKRIQSVVSALGLSVVNMIKVTGPQQVKLSVRVAEVVKGNPFRSGTAFRDKRDYFGLFPPGNLGTTANFLLNVDKVLGGNFQGNMTGDVHVEQRNGNGDVIYRAQTEVKSPQASIAFPHADGFQIGLNPRDSDIFGVLSILEGNNLARVLAKPELIVQAGETAEFLVGGEVPIPVAQDNNSVTVEYKEFGVRLKFSPVITEDGYIQMTVAPEISNIDESAGSQYGSVIVPGFRSRRAKTTVTLEAGQSFVIGGLIQDNLRSSVSKIPLLGDIPILGALFRSTSYEKDQSELAILVTPEFVKPIDKDAKVSLPGERLARPSASDGFWFGKVAEILPEGQSALPESLVSVGLEKP
ncbi:type II and III secretion system protein family protein [Thiomicrorhabdus cannonii]|uniref:type II and III secretion system protein family protein n=1 Tax=Thiomicrorhabdus cannonii TaxID=2748011 RepID=UPI001FE57768|nr:pilus assembly protein N-terminal domain-containing protein [Thiomicrorhabdus cannonii]